MTKIKQGRDRKREREQGTNKERRERKSGGDNETGREREKEEEEEEKEEEEGTHLLCELSSLHTVFSLPGLWSVVSVITDAHTNTLSHPWPLSALSG